MTNVRVLIADDHQLIRASLKSLIGDFDGVDVVGEAHDGFAAIEMTAKHRPDVVLMDIVMSGLNGLEATRRIAKEHSDVRVIVLSMHAGEQYVLPALRAGAAGYLLKESTPGELEMAIQSVARGEMFLSPAISKRVVDVFLGNVDLQRTSLEALTPRQREILQLIAEGHSSKQIALKLGASVKTIESHRSSLMERLDIHEVAGLVRYAIRHGLISSET
jgi:DNA-binding NarL/FixJ family response regulator